MADKEKSPRSRLQGLRDEIEELALTMVQDAFSETEDENGNRLKAAVCSQVVHVFTRAVGEELQMLLKLDGEFQEKFRDAVRVAALETIKGVRESVGGA